jgi:hypothetical protein
MRTDIEGTPGNDLGAFMDVSSTLTWKRYWLPSSPSSCLRARVPTGNCTWAAWERLELELTRQGLILSHRLSEEGKGTPFTRAVYGSSSASMNLSQVKNSSTFWRG